jgi:hypothetical protein
VLYHFNWELFDHTPYSPDLAQATTTCLSTWRTGWDHSASAIMRIWRKMSKRGPAHRRQTSMAQAYITYSPIHVPQFRWRPGSEVAYTCMYFSYIIKLFFSLLVFNRSPEFNFRIALI